MPPKSKSVHAPLPTDVRKELGKRILFDVLSADLIKEFRAFIFEKSDNEIKIAAVEPDNQSLQRFATTRFGDKTVWFLATEEDIASALAACPTNHQADLSEMTLANFDVNNVFTSNSNIVALVDRIIKYAMAEKASDIHIERVKNGATVRFRVDGVLHNVLSLPRGIHQAVIARFKILANLKIDEYRRPQDGRIELEDHPNTSLRVSTVPTLYGEKIAMRILNEAHKNLGIEHLGFNATQKALILRNIEKPFGMIITSGPTGSGKTTSLYGMINLLQKDQLNISTLEDPVEFALEGINQIQVNPRVDLTFASGLRTLLRQDPDVIMVGEIRDSETAVMAANAALTGHLVLTTIHTNDAPSVFPRLLEMKVEDFMVGSIINLVIAQRLVRRVCTNCHQDKKLDSAIIKKIRERADVMLVLEKKMVSLDELATKVFKAGKGCDYCLHTGYQGRVGLYELLEINKEIHDLILDHASSDRIREAANKEGFRDIVTDGIEKIFDGTTTFDEVLRTTRTT